MTTAENRTLHRLRHWSELWRFPRLFYLVHGARFGEPTPADLAEALLSCEVASVDEAWRHILDYDDVAAAQAAYDRLGSELGPDLIDGLEQTRARFVNRIELTALRARRLSSGGPAIETKLNAARDAVVADPAEAERALAEAIGETRLAEDRELERLAQSHPLNDNEDSRLERLHRAIQHRDVRLAQIYAGQLDNEARSTRPLGLDEWLNRQPIEDLLEWYLNPGLAPDRLPQMERSGIDTVLLAHLSRVVSEDDLSETDARQSILTAIMSIGGGAMRDGDLAACESPTQGVWAFQVRGPDAARLFPHAVDESGTVVVVAPRYRLAELPASVPAGRLFIAWDLFERWRGDGHGKAIRVTPRLVAQVLPYKADRIAAFVRLQSRTVAVRTLLIDILGTDGGRAMRLLGHEGGQIGSMPLTAVAGPLFDALDAYVDEDDIGTLCDACGNRSDLFLQVLHFVGGLLEPAAPLSDRRLDIFGILREPRNEAKVEQIVVDFLRSEFKDQWDKIIEALEMIDDVMKADEAPGAAPTRDELIQSIADAWSCTSGEASDRVNLLFSAQLLQEKEGLPRDRGQEPRIHRNLALPYRILLRRGHSLSAE